MMPGISYPPCDTTRNIKPPDEKTRHLLDESHDNSSSSTISDESVTSFHETQSSESDIVIAVDKSRDPVP